MNPSPEKELPASPSILIILMGSLGDVARGLCLVSHIKQQWPQSRVTWLVEPQWADLVRLHGQIDRTIVFQRAWRLSAIRQLYQDLRQDRYDIALDLQRIFKSGFFSRLSGAGRRVGFQRRNAKEFNWLFNTEHIGYFSDDLPKIRHYLKFTEYLGLPAPQSLEFGFSGLNFKQMAPRVVADLQQPFAAVVLGTSWKTKNWHLNGYRDLINRLLAGHGLKVVLIGDDSHTALAAKLTASVGSPDIIDLTGRTTMPQLVAVLKAAVVGVGPDSGPGHLAAAARTPFVALFGPTSPRRTAPFGCEKFVVKSNIDCAPCYRKRCPDRNTECMQSITADMVMEKVELALSEKIQLIGH
jgi:lipopolysaccharide heptosyltransferase II